MHLLLTQFVHLLRIVICLYFIEYIILLKLNIPSLNCISPTPIFPHSQNTVYVCIFYAILRVINFQLVGGGVGGDRGGWRGVVCWTVVYARRGMKEGRKHEMTYIKYLAGSIQSNKLSIFGETGLCVSLIDKDYQSIHSPINQSINVGYVWFSLWWGSGHVS